MSLLARTIRSVDVSRSLLFRQLSSGSSSSSASGLARPTRASRASAVAHDDVTAAHDSHDGHGHEEARLFGEPKLAPGQKREWEDWELPYYLGLGGGAVLLTVGLMLKPTTEIDELAREQVLASRQR